ncbi:hypothetical protein [Aminobacterium mobile]|uniref:hypothetical protein n=1 Tax=Aminobacterium mobile TaxID=81467 RepID=UPI003315CEC9
MIECLYDHVISDSTVEGTIPFNAIKCLYDLVAAFAPTAMEKEVAECIVHQIENLNFPCKTRIDSLGNLTIEPLSNSAPKIMLAAPIDQCSFPIIAAPNANQVRFAILGNVQPQDLPGNTVRFSNGAEGIIRVSDNSVSSVNRSDELLISLTEKSPFPQPGDRAILTGPFSVQKGVLSAPAMEGRLASWVFLSLMGKESIKKQEVLFAFCAHGVGGGRGCQVIAQTKQPQIAIGLDIEPIASTSPIHMGNGPVLRWRDENTISHPGLVRLAVKTAKEENIPLQISPISLGKANISGVHASGTNCAVLSLSIPVQKAYTPQAFCSLEDCHFASCLLEKIIDRLL